MIEGLSQLRCGNCGHTQFKLYQAEKSTDVHSQCTTCGSTTVITITSPKIDFRFGEHSDGILAKFGGMT